LLPQVVAVQLQASAAQIMTGKGLGGLTVNATLKAQRRPPGTAEAVTRYALGAALASSC
jgi:hypothetical protein